MIYSQFQYFNHKFEIDVIFLLPFISDSIPNWCSLESFQALLLSYDVVISLRRIIRTQSMLNDIDSSLTFFSTYDGFLCPKGSISAVRQISSFEALGLPNLSTSLLGL